MDANVYGFEHTSGAGQELTGRVWNVMLSAHKMLIDIAGPLSIFMLAFFAVCLIAAAFLPESRKKILCGMAFVLLGFLLIYAVPTIVGLVQHFGNMIQKGGV